MDIRKKFLTGVILASLFTSLPYTVFAEEYISNDGGFKIDVPEENFAVMAGNNFIISHSLRNGIHAIKQISKVGEKSSIDFNKELEKIAVDIKAKKDILSMPEYKYLITDQNRPMPAELEQAIGNNIVKSTYKITRINNIPALEVNTTSKIKTKVDLRDKAAIVNFKMKFPKAKPSADGSSLEIEQTAHNNIYYVTKNNHLYQISNGYTDVPLTLTERQKIELTMGDLSFLEDFNLFEYKRMTKYFTKKINFFPPKPSNDLLLANDPIMKQKYSIPHDWMYGYIRDFSEDGNFNYFGSFPYTSYEKFAAKTIKDSNIKPVIPGSPLCIDLNADVLKLQNIVTFRDNLFLSISINSKRFNETIDGFIKSPSTATKLASEVFSSPFFRGTSTDPYLNNVITLNHFVHSLSFNPSNYVLVASNFNYNANIPNKASKGSPKTIQSLLRYYPYNIDDTFNIKGLCQNAIFINKDHNINIMVYLTADEKSINQDIENTFTNAQRYQRIKTVKRTVK